MAFFESAEICSTYEYNRHINSRLDLASAKDDDLIVLMILLNGVHEAAKMPARLIEKTRPKGLLHVDIAFLDIDLNEKHSEIFATHDDFLLVQNKLLITVGKESSRAVECYTRDYFEDQMPPEFLVSQAKDLERDLILS